jgi:hypothetical protein
MYAPVHKKQKSKIVIMKKILIVLFGLGIVSLYFSCNEDSNPMPTLQEEMHISQIAGASSVEAVHVQDLPPAIAGYVRMNHAPLEIDLAFHAAPHGYEVFLENGLCLFFDENGEHLNHDGMHGDMGNHHGGGDHGINFCLAGDTLEVAALPQDVIDYITANHSGASVVTVVVKPSGNLAVEISTGDILMFGPNGDYFHDCDMQATGGHGHGHGNIGNPGWHCDPDGGMGGGHGGPMGHGNHGGMDNHSGPGEHCWGGTSISIDDLPTAITTYINDNHADATIEHVMQTFNNNYFLRLSDCARLVFDEDGNILFDSGD